MVRGSESTSRSACPQRVDWTPGASKQDWRGRGRIGDLASLACQRLEVKSKGEEQDSTLILLKRLDHL